MYINIYVRFLLLVFKARDLHSLPVTRCHRRKRSPKYRETLRVAARFPLSSPTACLAFSVAVARPAQNVRVIGKGGWDRPASLVRRNDIQSA